VRLDAEREEYLSFRLMVAVPTHSGSLVVEAAEALLSLQQLVLERGGSLIFHHERGAMINVVRNAIVAEFMESDADLLLMLDADTAVHRQTFARMIDLGQPFVGCVYPKRQFDWTKVDLSIAGDVDELLYQASKFVGFLDQDDAGRVNVVDGFALATQIGGGAILLRREMFERMMAAYPELEGKGFEAGTKYSFNWGFFNSVLVDGLPQSEDISFCMRWRAIGGEIWADIASPVMHVGQYQYAGNYIDYLAARAKLKSP
jgi:hypothetical protein